MHAIHLGKKPGHWGFHRDVIGKANQVLGGNPAAAKPSLYIRMGFIDQESIRRSGTYGAQQIKIAHTAAAEEDRGVILNLACHQKARLPLRRSDPGGWAGEVVFGQAAIKDGLAQRRRTGAEWGSEVSLIKHYLKIGRLSRIVMRAPMIQHEGTTWAKGSAYAGGA